MKEVIEEDGRKYKVHESPDEQQGAYVIIGPPKGLVDELGLPPEIATKLHNILYERGILSSKEAGKPHAMFGVLQELYAVDISKIVEKFFSFEKETV